MELAPQDDELRGLVFCEGAEFNRWGIQRPGNPGIGGYGKDAGLVVGGQKV